MADKQNIIYVNVRQQVCSVAPVFHFSQIDQILNGILGLKIDHVKVEQEVDRIKKTLNLMCNTHPLIQINDSHMLNGEDENQQENYQLSQNLENQRLNKQLESELEKLDLRIKAQFKDVIGDNKDEISLLNEITGKFFQGIPQYNAVEQAHDNPLLRFYCQVKINGREVGRGIAQNKKQAKYLSAIQALKNVCPKLYEEWKVKYRNGGIIGKDSQAINEILNDPSKLRDLLNQEKDQEVRQHQLMESSGKKSKGKFISPSKPSGMADKENQLSYSNEDSQSSSNMENIDSLSQPDGDDTEIDDPELMQSKKHLCQKFTPLTVVKSLEGKHKNLNFQEHLSESKDTLKNMNVYTIIFSIRGYEFEGRATDYNKQRARQVAAQRFLKSLFPKTFTWKRVILHLTQLKEPLNSILEIE
ncbi:UNKNOWN [Stylonychia lemnae]|uniref:DRBM domain-containing protein n=1 Tax=Stylonychia lemnae TaxID=5949 RepID=A0A078B1Q8_STYLE|nr:UNKNOWN [Stylonychia lemnae]|eukprot:CDW87208.1 UNKNOWN [Stylonychia lemnae]